ncbi:MAG: YdhR family protein [Chitinophagaceae bacterium]|nr:YdhR family protein [Rubrivivax sp.]
MPVFTSAAAVSSLALALGLLAVPFARAQTPDGPTFAPQSAAAVVVKVPKPWYAPKSLVVSRMRETVPQYSALPGLAHKAFSLAQSDARYGGIYLWKDEAAARTFFGPAWHQRVEKERGATAQVQFFEVPVAIDNATGGSVDTAAVGTLVTLAVPVGITKARLRQEFEAAIPIYQKVPGLLRKYFILSEDGRFGGIYLWQDSGSAQRWFNHAWTERVLKTYGAPATIEWFDTPILLPSTLADNKPAIPGL